MSLPLFSAAQKRRERCKDGAEKGRMSMDKILNRLVEADRKASALVEEAEEYLDSTVSNMDREVEEFKKGYEEKAVHRIGIIRDEEDKASMESLADISKRYESLMSNMEQVYEKNHVQWEQELFNRCVGR